MIARTSRIRRLASSGAVFGGVFGSALLSFFANDAHAEDVDPEAGDFADGTTDVKSLETRNKRELASWVASRPPEPYVYPERDLTLGAAWGPLFDAFDKGSGALVASTLIPHFGVTILGGTPQATLAWPWSFPLGPKLSATRDYRKFDVYVYRPFRLIFEPILVVGDEIRFALRPGIRFLHHPSTWPVGIGAGVGANLTLAAKGGSAIAVSPEAVVQIGRCCRPSYITLAIRPDIFVTGETSFVFSTHVGFTYF